MFLKEHNQKAYNNLQKMYEDGKNRVAVVHPTGTGKTYITMQLIKDNPSKKIIVVSPTNLIITQYQKRLEENEIDYRNVEFLTYSKIMNMSKEEIEKLKAENIVLDEFHHCGAEEWGKGVKRLLEGNSGAKVLGLSATPIRYLDNLRNMAEEVFEGNIASEISLPEALVDGLFEIPIYHQGLYSVREEEEKRRAMIESLSDEEAKEALRKELEKVKDAASKIEGTKEILTKGIPEDKKAGKIIVFCRDIKDMHKAMKKAASWL